MAINYFAPLMLDDYKLNHPFQYPVDTEEVYANQTARGYLMVSNGIGGYTLEQNVTPKQERQGCLETVFKNGKLVKFQNIHEIRARVKKEYILA